MAIPGYRIIRKIRQGGMSTVYLAIQSSVDREVALKVMSPSLASDPSFGSRFYREAKIVGKLSHPNIVSIYDVGSHKHYNYITMDYLPGAALQDRLERGLSTREAVRVIKEVAAALAYAHKSGYIHRDIKPDNILFREDGSAVLCDFGIAKALKGNIKMTGVGAVLGTPHYMSPEQAQGKTVDGRADIYSLGVVLFEILTGQVPFSGDDAIAVAVKHMTSAVPKLPRQHKKFQPLIDRMMAKKASDRYQTGEQVIAALDQLSETLNQKSLPNQTHTGSTTVQVVNLISVLLAALWSAINLAVKRLMLTNITFSSTTAQLSNKQLEDLDSFIFNEDYSELPEELSDMPLIQDTIEQPAIRYQRRKLLAPMAIMCAVAAGLLYVLQPTAQPIPTTTAPIITTTDTIPATAEQNLATVAPIKPALIPTPDDTDEQLNLADSLALDATVEPIAETAAESIQAPAEPLVQRYPLTITTTPDHAKIRILNIKPRYQHGMGLTKGAYHIEVQAEDYLPQKIWLRIKQRPLTRHISLTPTRRLLASGSITRDNLSVGGDGPPMVVLPKSSSPLSDADAQPALDYALAISQYEITFTQYDSFARQTSRLFPDDFGWGRGDRPVVGISYHDALAYAAWLSEQTGQRYRLPTQQEWQYAYRGGQAGQYWWGDKQAEKRANCKRGCKSKYSKLFSSSTAPAGSFAANPYGVYDTAGNVAEWLDACNQWQDESQTHCQSTLIAGGSHQDSASNIHADSTTAITTESTTKYIGLRLVLEL
jgi:serine/threonine-protein kinase PpkA